MGKDSREQKYREKGHFRALQESRMGFEPSEKKRDLK